jgi:serine/threonine protein kinase
MAAGGGERDPVTIGPYRLVNRIGEGGMGVVHLALDSQGRAVALKVLRAHVAADPEARLRLRREVETLRRVQHRRVAGVLDADVDGELPYLVTQFVPGRSLERLVQEDGPLTTPDVVRLGCALAEALQAIHDVGVVHRDVKPPNVVLVDGEPVLIDFGIAHVAEDTRITVAGLVMGTPGYLSPEVSIGEPVAPPTDWWGWGATLAFAATGRNPFGTGPVEVVLDRVRRGTVDLAGVPEPVRTALSAALIVDPGHRPPGAQLVGMLSARPVVVLTEPVPAVTTTMHVDADDMPFLVASAPAARATTPLMTPPTRPYTPAPGPPSASPPGRAPLGPNGYARFHTSPTPTAPPASVSPSPSSGQPSSGQPSPVHSAANVPARAPAGLAAPAPAPTAVAPHQNAPPAAVPAASVQLQPQELRHPDQAPVPSDHLARSGVLACAWLAVTALATVTPVMAALMAVAGMVLARTVDRSMSALWRRRAGIGVRGSDVPMTLLALPWRVLLSVLATIPALFMPLAAGIVTVFSVGVIPAGSGVPLGSQHPVSLAAGMGVALLIAWWGFGGSSLRRGTRLTARAFAPGDWGPPIAAGLLVLVVLACLAVASRGVVDWSPLNGPPGASTGL